jgi:PBP1b-binding outer membrane lipoprotein LpoB
MIKKYAVILLAGLMLIGCSSQSNVKASKGKTSKEESELKDPADSFIYEANKTKHTQTVILEIESK